LFVPGSDLRLAARYQAAESWLGTGGDWFDAFRIARGGAAVVIGDVAGHDGRAAAGMASLRGALRGLAMSGDATPSDVLGRLDATLCRLRPGVLATVLYGQLRPSSEGLAELRWCNAGHLPPLLLDSDGSTTSLDSVGDLLLGTGMTLPRTNLSMTVPHDSTLMLFTDGLVETRTGDLDAGVDRLRRAAAPLAAHDVADLCDLLVPAMVGATARDDVALLAVRPSRYQPREVAASTDGDDGRHRSTGGRRR
jgi:serine phosphatase RsbU (regulator of sigma subunit)